MSGNELINEIGEGVEEVIEVPTSNGSTIAKVAVVGTVVAAGVAVVMYVRKRRRAKAENETVEVVKEKNSKKKTQE